MASGVVARVHGNKGKPKKTGLSLKQIQDIVQFIMNYAGVCRSVGGGYRARERGEKAKEKERRERESERERERGREVQLHVQVHFMLSMYM